jgi:hypothetical protein
LNFELSGMTTIDTHRLLLIIVGADIKAEIADRPFAYRLQKTMLDWIATRTHDDDWSREQDPVPVVCSDIWYLNNDELHDQPLVSIGGPGVNAVASFLQSRVPNTLVIEDKLLIQIDIEFNDLRASLWGMNHQQTSAAVELFEKRYFLPYMQAVLASM